MARNEQIEKLIHLSEERERSSQDIINDYVEEAESDDEEEEVNDGSLNGATFYQGLRGKRPTTWVKTIGMKEDLALDIWTDASPHVAELEASTGRKGGMHLLDAILALILLFHPAPSLDELGTRVGRKKTALATGLEKARLILRRTLEIRWWTQRRRPEEGEWDGYPGIALLVDSTSFQVYRPVGKFQEAKQMWDGKNCIYARKFQVAVQANKHHYAMFVSQGFRNPMQKEDRLRKMILHNGPSLETKLMMPQITSPQAFVEWPSRRLPQLERQRTKTPNWLRFAFPLSNTLVECGNLGPYVDKRIPSILRSWMKTFRCLLS
eukprot:TRINITY_DN9020_c0_g1_i4.p1 TRINITY_DN9020_c0_g1~~TRINITY_DN9020_c0_g1_i4.p1  ORF type:complete len:322 (+),score=43.42 TRINITY_DN9020_c0_g1_i4:142-1107(+)